MCPKCGKPLVLRQSKKGAFAGCSGFPKCRHLEPIELDSNTKHIETSE
jgi:DNA topoisomerase-1